MLIVVDENIPFAAELLAPLGDVRLVPGRGLSADALRLADALIVRSVTRVGPDLLALSPLRFVATATIGTDHVDLPHLAARAIGFASAPGSNAESVAQYVAAALAHAAGRLGRPLSHCSLGIVGVGNCGSRVDRIARALGLEVRLCDPPLSRRTGDPQFQPLDALLDCDFITVHVPLTRTGEDPTFRLISAPLLDRLRPGATVINASRGFVVDEPALMARVEAGRLAPPVLDAWENEPAIDPEHLRRALIGTPHIAGYSYDGKVAGAVMVARAAFEHFGVPFDPPPLDLPAPPLPRIDLPLAGRSADSVLAELVTTAYPILRDDADLRAALAASPESVGPAFDRRRKLYPLRREFSATRLRLPGADPKLLRRAAALGFQFQDAAPIA